jgi:lysophospholipid acyltransferase (LPLAT)-like uncharacterized protein
VQGLRGLCGLAMGIVAKLWLRTLRVTLTVDDALSARPEPWVLSFFHGTQFPLLAWPRRRPTAVMVSHSRDGTMQAAALSLHGFDVVRGSTSRGGARALARMVRMMRRASADAAFAVDGPRGPYGKAKEGAIVAARATGGVLVPMGSACARAWVLRRAWDRFTLPLPFSRVAVVLGPPIEAHASKDALERAIESANAAARYCL